MIRRFLKSGFRAARSAARAGTAFVRGPGGPGYGVSEFEDFERIRNEAAAQDLAEGVTTAGSDWESIAEGTREISAEDLRILLEIEEPEERPLLLDVREQSEWTAGHVEGAIHIPLGSLESRANELDATRSVVLYCAGGARSIDASYILKDKGFAKVASLAGGTAAWTQAGNILTS